MALKYDWKYLLDLEYYLQTEFNTQIKKKNNYCLEFAILFLKFWIIIYTKFSLKDNFLKNLTFNTGLI